MSAALEAWIANFIVIGGATFIGYQFVDLVFFIRAGICCIKAGRFSEWRLQPNRMLPGSGFRLYRHFRQSAKSVPPANAAQEGGETP